MLGSAVATTSNRIETLDRSRIWEGPMERENCKDRGRVVALTAVEARDSSVETRGAGLPVVCEASCHFAANVSGDGDGC